MTIWSFNVSAAQPRAARERLGLADAASRLVGCCGELARAMMAGRGQVHQPSERATDRGHRREAPISEHLQASRIRPRAPANQQAS
jgi:hypothetical protein